MVSYYKATELLKEHLKADRQINSVFLKDLNEVDIKKQTIFPLAHVQFSSATNLGGFSKFTTAVTCMDIVKENISGNFAGDEYFDNKHDVLNTMQAVLEGLEKSLEVGTLSDLGLRIEAKMSLDRFEDRFENLLTGWSASFDILVPNDIQSCGNSYALGDITFSNTLITFSNDNG